MGLKYPSKRIGVRVYSCKPCWKTLTVIGQKTSISEIKQKTGFSENNIYVYLGLLKKINLIEVGPNKDPRSKLYSLSGDFHITYLAWSAEGTGEIKDMDKFISKLKEEKEKNSKVNKFLTDFFEKVKNDPNVTDLDFFLRAFRII